MADLQKVDTGLFIAWRAYQESQDKNPEDGISISLRFEGEIAPIEALGFKSHAVLGNQALGVVKFKDIEVLDAHPGVLWMAAGQTPQISLNTAVTDIKARATSLDSSGLPVNALWHAVEATGNFKGLPDATGKDVFIGIIDTGIDYKHPMFMSDLGPPKKKTRIFRIWDQGLRPAVVAEGPDKKYLVSPNTYGVEYKQEEIESALNGGAQINHRDCIGHGTHVAGIAAGGTKFHTPGGDAKFVGVAPEASIIAVKLIDTPDSIRYRLENGFGEEVKPLTRLTDAVVYCFEIAKEAQKPVVVNMSFGDSSQPGDGLDDTATFFDFMMDPSRPETGVLAYPKGYVLVTAAGNEGDPAERRTARIVVPGTAPALGEITVPLELKDTRGAEKDSWLQCEKQLYKPPVGVHFWYRRANPFDSVKFALRMPGQSDFSGDMHVGGFLRTGFVIKPGTPPKVELRSVAPNVHKVLVRHETNAEVFHPKGAIVRRHRVEFQIEPKESGGTISYHPGIYEMRIKAPVGTEIFVMCDRRFWSRDHGVTFEIAKTLEPGIILTNRRSLTDTLGQHVITVAAYDDKNGGGPDRGEIAAFSSRGPLRDFSNPPEGPIAAKPDIAAPGVKIMSAESFNSEPPPGGRTPSWNAGIRFTEFDGTSMATPMVTGVIALLLDKKKDMTITDVRDHLTAKARAAVKPSTAPDSKEAYGSGRVDAFESHKRIT